MPSRLRTETNFPGTSGYRSPYVEDCVDETQEGDREVLPPNSTFVIDYATTPSPEVTRSEIPVFTAGPILDARRSSAAEQSVSSCGNDALIRSLPPGSRESRPYFSRGSEKTELRRKTSIRSSESTKVSVVRNQSEENTRTSEPPPQARPDNPSDDEDQSAGEPRTEDHGPKRGADRTAEPPLQVKCYFCDGAYYIKILGRIGGIYFNKNLLPIEEAPCGHWLCHFCLMERFARSILFEEASMKCCWSFIPLELFHRILVDPEVNALKRCRASAKSSAYRRLLCTLLRKRPFVSGYIAEQIQDIIGRDVWRQLEESASQLDERQAAKDECHHAEQDEGLVSKYELSRSYSVEDAHHEYVPETSGGSSDPSTSTLLGILLDQQCASNLEDVEEFMSGEKTAPPSPPSSQPQFSETIGGPISLLPDTVDEQGCNRANNPPGYEPGRENDESTGRPPGVPQQPPSADRTPKMCATPTTCPSTERGSWGRPRH
ncbi:hypothetical protein NLG97_g9711 [Lecanicillium saksenae]|uniref:Uncharacterized protein n=1 Tax=Lecanicillium saksenae TaxID=468837 RepID=A0ACC1QFF9_9HYPO|nr:hypothetical protein NLG97_g9711 [Lecanicillium saksenae]